MVRVLQIVDSMDMGGIQTFIMNVYRHIDRTKIQFDFLIFRLYEQKFEKEIIHMGGKVYKIPGRKAGLLKNLMALKDFYRNHKEYKIVHYHTSSLSYLTPLVIAQKEGITKRILHSHNTKNSGSFVHRILHEIHKSQVKKIVTDYLACGELAADWMYRGTGCREKAIVIANGIDVRAYAYDEDKRLKIRKEFHVSEDCLVIGNVGRFADSKNHEFLISIFSELSKRVSNTVLLLVGDGELRSQIEKKVEEEQLKNQVIFCGVRNDVDALLQAMDIYIMPSLYEGFPVSAVEAQAAGLPCYISDMVTKEVLINPNVKQISLSRSPSEWADNILISNNRYTDFSGLIRAGYDISSTVEKLCKIYFEV